MSVKASFILRTQIKIILDENREDWDAPLKMVPLHSDAVQVPPLRLCSYLFFM